MWRNFEKRYNGDAVEKALRHLEGNTSALNETEGRETGARLAVIRSTHVKLDECEGASGISPTPPYPTVSTCVASAADALK